MKRHGALAQLSRDHHQALVQALALKRASAEDADEVRARALEFFEGHGFRHFRVEEDVLLPWFARHADPDAPEVVRVLTDHVALRRDVGDLSMVDGADIELMHRIGERLDAHVRHEERVLFPMIELALPEEELARLAAAVDQPERDL